MYFDDRTLQDFASCGTKGQTELSKLAGVFGTPFASHKRQVMFATNDILGLERDPTDVMDHQTFRFGCGSG